MNKETVLCIRPYTGFRNKEVMQNYLGSLFTSDIKPLR